jgi:hypothetical protein
MSARVVGRIDYPDQIGSEEAIDVSSAFGRDARGGRTER